MDKDKAKEFLMHNDSISAFNNELYSDIFSQENIVSKKKVIVKDNVKYYGYYLEKGNEIFFMSDNLYSFLPFKVTDTEEIDYKGDVINFIHFVKSIKIPSEKQMSFRELVDVTPAFKHTNENHFLLYKICSIASWVDRTNFRVVTDAGFGKDSVVNILSYLVDSTANIYGATFPKLEYNLLNRLIVLNELGNLKKDDKQNMQEFLLATGAYFNTYTKRSRRTADTLEQYDISDISLIVFYNLPGYYISKGQEYFDTMFTEAVNNRFIPFYFEGRLATKFGELIDPEKVLEYGRETYKKVIATLNYYKNNNVKELKYKVPDIVKFTKEEERYSRSFYTIMKYIGDYAETQDEFDYLVTELYNCYKNYAKLVKQSKVVFE